MLIGSPIYDAKQPFRSGQLRSIGKTYAVARTPSGELRRILLRNVRRGIRPPSRVPQDHDPETLRLAIANGVSYAMAKKVRT